MTIVRQQSLSKAVESPEKLAHKHLTTERMQDVHLLLQNLVNSEEATVKLVLDCLYDIGAVNLIDQKFRSRFLNKTMKKIARMSKPVFRVFAWQWFKKNSPQLIANWLQTQVAFVAPAAKPKKVVVEVPQVHSYSLVETDSLRKEIKYLRYQVRWLTAITVVALSAFGITITTLNYNSAAPLQSRQSVPFKMPD
ncbi:hypothetical protein [Nostoc sp. FACHB-145]|uniref:hypothetical protein n=1 Tax=Nostoc sp. FACHB-145 TaxID=2692836 RepID=UPI0016864ED5|nr:hypothetical protein [Nostoc sp. FACHB-145]MBD2467188.1 hypothetical protein [Nostoc sp. FACHB-145]